MMRSWRKCGSSRRPRFRSMLQRFIYSRSTAMAAAVSRWPRRRVAVQVRPRVAACSRARPQPLRAPSHASVCIPRPFLLPGPTLKCHLRTQPAWLPHFSSSASQRVLDPVHLPTSPMPPPPCHRDSSVSLRPARATTPSLLLADSGAPSHSHPLPLAYGVHAWNPLPLPVLCLSTPSPPRSLARARLDPSTLRCTAVSHPSMFFLCQLPLLLSLCLLCSLQPCSAQHPTLPADLLPI